MAGGESPRQKMINLLYLVLIAMLAINMSKEVLNAFGSVKESLEKTSENSSTRNEAALKQLAQLASDQPEKYADKFSVANSINSDVDNYVTYLESIKTKIFEINEIDPSSDDYQTMDGYDKLNEYFFPGGELGPNGQEFLDKMNSFKTNLKTKLGDSLVPNSILTEIDETFSIEEETNRDGDKVEWLKYNYEGFPMIAALTNISKLQNDAKIVESDILSNITQTAVISESSFSNYGSVTYLDKSAVFGSEPITGYIALGRTDESTKPVREELKVGGRTLVKGKDYEIKGGKVEFKFAPGGVGKHEITGKLFYKEKGEEFDIDVNQEYVVLSRPGDPVVSADKMNVFYRGVDNPISVSAPGVTDDKVRVTGAKKVGNGKYVVNNTHLQGANHTISVVATLPDGTTKKAQKPFRIKNVPPAIGKVRGKAEVTTSVGNLLKGTVEADLEDFPFDLDMVVTGYTIKVPGQPTIRVTGNRLRSNPKVASALNRMKIGEDVTIGNIKTKIKQSGVKGKDASPIIIHVNAR